MSRSSFTHSSAHKDMIDKLDISISNLELAVHLLQPCGKNDISMLSRAISQYKITTRTAIFRNAPVEDVIGPPEIDVSAFLKSKDSKDCKRQFPRVGRWLSLINNTFDDVDVFVRLGCMYLQWHLMRVSTLSRSRLVDSSCMYR